MVPLGSGFLGLILSGVQELITSGVSEVKRFWGLWFSQLLGFILELVSIIPRRGEKSIHTLACAIRAAT